MSQSFSSDQSKFFFEQELERTVHALSHWMIINNYSKASVRIIKNIFSKALRSLVAPTDLEPSALLRNISFLSAVKDESDREVYTQRLFNVLLLMGEDSLEMGLENEIFSFTEINPGIGAFGLASINLGGFPHGARLVSSIASPAFRENRGSDSDLEPYLPVHLTLVNLPFSVFVGTGNADPSVVKIVEEAASNRANTKCTIFRVDWTIGKRLGVDPSVYERFVARYFLGQQVQSKLMNVEWFVPMGGYELFIAVAPSFNSDIRPYGEIAPRRLASSFVDRGATGQTLPQSIVDRARRFPRQNAARIDCDYWNDPIAAVIKTDCGFRRLVPCEVMRLLGMSGEYRIPSDEATAYHLLGESVVVPVAEWFVRGVLRALR